MPQVGVILLEMVDIVAITVELLFLEITGSLPCLRHVVVDVPIIE
jgi:hypothetical protein